MAVTAPRLEARIVAAASQYGGHVDAHVDRYVDAGSYFLGSEFDPAGALAGFLNQWASILSVDVPGTTVTLDIATGKVTVTWGTGTHTFTFASSALKLLLGFSANLTPAAASFTGTWSAAAVWLPLVPPARTLGPVDGLGDRREDARSSQAPSGDVWVTEFGTFYDQRWEFSALQVRKVYAGKEAVVNESFESFWRVNIAGGDRIVRYYPDATAPGSYTSSGTPRDYKIVPPYEPPTRFVTKPNRDLLWNLAFAGKLFAH